MSSELNLVHGAADGDSATSDSVLVDIAQKGGGKEAGDAGSPVTGSTKLTYGQVQK